MKRDDGSVRFMYGTAFGRALLKFIQWTHVDRIAVWFLRSRLSKPFYIRFAGKNGIALTEEDKQTFRTYRDFFLRERDGLNVDDDPDHLISPCDGYLSVYPVDKDSVFSIKGSHYRVSDLMQDPEAAKGFEGGTCLVFRLCASDYHHYCYIDDGYQGKNHFIPGVLHSVQPIACETYPVFTLNRRSWCLMETDHFGPVVQTEIGALIVGGIVNHQEEGSFVRGQEKGHFDLAGSTITLLFEPDRIGLLPEIEEALKKEEEVRVTLGMCVGYRKLFSSK